MKLKRSLQYASLFITTFVKKHFLFLAVSIIAGFVFTLIFIKIYPIYLEVSKNRHLKIGRVGFTNQNTLPTSIKNKISLGITGLKPSGEATSSIAKKWQIRDDGKVYIFELRDDLTWHKGDNFIAEDVNYNFKGIKYIPIDDTTLKVFLDEPYAPLLTLFSDPITRSGLEGLGPYRVDKINYKENRIFNMTLRPISSKLPALTYKFYSNLDDAIFAFKMGEIDVLENVSNVGDMQGWKSIEIDKTTMFDKYVGVFFNLNNDLFREKEIRQALAYASPDFEKEKSAHSPISPLSWAYNPNVKKYQQDLEAAQEILANSPLSSPSSQIYLSTFATTLDTAQKIVNEWNKTGLNIKVKVENSIPQDYQMFLLTQIIPPDPDQYHYWQSTQTATNITNYQNPKIDKLLEDGRRTIKKEERIQIYQDFQRYLTDDVPVIFLFHPSEYTIKRSYINY